MRCQVAVAVHVGWEGRGRVGDGEGHAVVEDGRPEGRVLGFDNGGAAGGVSGYEVGEAGEAGGELGLVAGAGVRHGWDCLLACFFFFFLLPAFSARDGLLYSMGESWRVSGCCWCAQWSVEVIIL